MKKFLSIALISLVVCSQVWANGISFIGGRIGTDDQTAAEVPFTPNGSIAATDVQAAIQEVRDEAGTSHTQGTDTALGTLGTKNPLIDADKVIYRDSTNSDALVTSTWTQVKAFLKAWIAAETWTFANGITAPSVTVPQSATAQLIELYEGSGDGTNKHAIQAKAMASDRLSLLPDYVIGFPNSSQVSATGALIVDASGFNGNLATTDDTLQEVAQKLDDLSVSGGTVATSAEINTGTNNDKFVSPDALAGSNAFTKSVCFMVKESDAVTAVADGKQAFVVPASMNGMNLIDVTASVADLNSASGGATTVVIRRVRGATAANMTSTGVTISHNEYTASDETVDTSNDDLETGDKIYIDTNAVTTGAVHKGLSVTASFRLP